MICTFYSFKGGVGRSMALANVAELYYALGLNVLIVDFDLEAPGLERYFAEVVPDRIAEIQAGRGVIDMVLSFRELQSYAAETMPAPEDSPTEKPLSVEPLDRFIINIYNDPTRPGKLALLPSGNRTSPDFAAYAKRVLAFDWSDFYQKRDGERFFDWLRQELSAEKPDGWDIVLIDSRTGITEIGGVCTHHLPDAVVSFVATNYQNLEGAKMMAQSLSNPQLVDKARRGAPLHQLFVPSRVEISEEDKHDEFAQRFNQELGQWFPTHLTPERSWFVDLKLSYVPAYSYMERLAVRETSRASKLDLIEAYRRLASRIAQLAGRGRLFDAYRPAPGLISNVPSRNPHFVGREEELKRIRAALSAGKAPVVIYGTPGIGKTCVAVEYAVQYRNEYFATFWTCAADEGQLTTGCEEIARLVGRQNQAPRDAVRTWLETHDNWLLIIDDATDSALVQSWLPTSLRGHVIFTTRVQGFNPSAAQPILIDLLSPADSVAFISKRLNRAALGQKEQRAAQELAQELGWLPLALEQAAAYIASRNVRISDFLASFRRRRIRLLDQQKAISAGKELSLNAVFGAAVSELDRAPASLDLLRVASILAPDEIPLELLIACAPHVSEDLKEVLKGAEDDPLAVDDALEPLTRLSLINRKSESHTVSVHTLLQEFVRDRMGDRMVADWRIQATQAIQATLPEPNRKNLVIWDRAIPHVRELLAQAPGGTAPARLTANAGVYAYIRGQISEAEPLLELAVQRSSASGDQGALLTALPYLADLRVAQNRLADGERLAHQSLEISNTLKDEHARSDSAVRGLAVLGRIAQNRSELDAAQHLFEQMLTLNPTDQELTVFAATQLAAISYINGNRGEAENYLLRARELGERDGGVTLAAALFANVKLRSSLGGENTEMSLREAQHDLLQALSLVREQFGSDHPQGLPILQELGIVHLRMNDIPTAIDFLTRAIDMQRRTFGSEHPSLAQMLGILAVATKFAKRFEESEEHFSEALHIVDKAYGPEAKEVSAFREQFEALLNSAAPEGSAESA